MSRDSCTTAYRDIPGFPGYRVGDDGSVWSCRERLWVPGKPGSTWRLGGEWHRLRELAHNGYMTVVLYPGQVRIGVHRVVLLAFVGPPPSEHLDACHGDGNPANNRLDNLRWDTRSGNMADAVRHGTTCRGSKHGGAKLDEAAVRLIRSMAGRATQREIANKIGVTRSLISAVLRKKCWAWLD